MANIYRREPNYHGLPTGWSDMDAVKFSNINNIAGLQHVDNALVANQNGTYSCKNVYQDESGNLTVRPSLRQLKFVASHHDIVEKLRGLYKVSCGTIMYWQTSSGNNILEFYDTEGRYVTTRSGHLGNITVQESDGKAYILAKLTSGKLYFFYFDGSEISPVEPEILANSAEKPISRLYNILSDKIKYETTAVLPRTISNSLFTDFSSIHLDKADAIAFNIMKSGHVIFVYSSAIVVAVPYGSVFKFIEIPVSIDFDDSSKILIEDVDSAEHCVVTVATKTNGSIACTVYAVYYSGDAISSKYSVEVTDIKAFEIGYEGSLFIAHGVDDPLGSDKYTLAITWYKNGAFKLQYDFHNEFTFSDMSSADVKLAASKKAVLSVIQTSYDTYVAAQDLEYWVNLASGKNEGKEYQVVKYDVGDWNYFTPVSGYENWYLLDTKSGNFRLYTDWEYVIRPDTTVIEQDPIIPDFTVSGITSFVATPYGLIVYTDYKHHYITSTIQRSYDFSFDDAILPVIFDIDSVLTVAETTDGYDLYTRNILPQYVLAERPVSDELPVLSQISDEVITSFYLDNIYWFVTKHRVFGTGVANEQFSITYFDPRKYFYFDEEITAAIRISDSSFWVFHNNGAYLIYKSTSQLYDEITGEYMEIITWLCTSTAESKGCDFSNAVMTLPITNYVACVTADDISSVQMRENVQTDDRILVPMTLGIQKFVAGLLHETASVKTGVFRYNALFFLNPQSERGSVPVLVFNATNESWWYWELPVDRIIQTQTTESGIELVAKIGDEYVIYDLYTEYYSHTIGGLTYELYADRILDSTPTQIEWFWESAILHFGTIDNKKQLLYTNFTFGERDSATVNFEYNFEVYDREYSACTWTDVTQVVERAKTCSNKNIIAKFMYLQLYLKSTNTQDFDALTRPKISSISFKYRILPGGLL